MAPSRLRRRARGAPLRFPRRLLGERLEERRLLAVTVGGNTSPTMVFVADQQATVGQELALTFAATDPNGDTIGFALDPDETPSGATVDRQSGEFRWTPSAEGIFRFVALAIDQGARPLMDAQVFRVTVSPQPANQPPEIAAPAAATANEDVPLAFTSANAIILADPDAASGDLEVTLAATNGDLSFSNTTGLTFSAGTGSHDATMTFRGTLAAVNGALGGLTYLPALNYHGPATMSIAVSDLGNTGSGGALSDSGQIEITVNAVNDAPTFTKGPDIVMAEDSPADSIPWATVISPGPVDEAGQSVTFLVQADRPELFLVQPTVAPDGTLSFTPAPNAFGEANISVVAQDDGGTANGGVSTSTPQVFTFTLLAVNDRPELPPLADRTGNVNSPLNFVVSAADPDNDTQSYQVFVDSQPVGGNGETATMNPDTGEFSFTPNLEGVYVFLVGVVDSGNPALSDTSSLMVVVSADAPAVAPPVFELSVGSNVIATQTTQAAKVTLVGQTSPLAAVTLLESGAATVADAQGDFYFADVALAVGHNTLTARASLGGQTAEFQRVLQRQSGMLADPVLAWNQEMLIAIKNAALPPPVASRIMAIASVAVMDAVSAIEGTPATFVAPAAPAGANVQAAVIGAAHRALTALIPSQQTAFDALRASQLASLPNDQSVADGLAVGEEAADGILAIRASDGSTAVVAYTPGTDPGDWQPTPPAFAAALLPQWAQLTPFVMTSPGQFLPAGPPALDSPAWAAAFNEVKDLGGSTSANRTADQTQIARYWADNAGTYTPPGHWNQIAADVAEAAGNSLSSNVRLLGELNLALADAAIAAWNAKYAYDTWRPITAIQNADSANNPLVTADPTWTPLLATPPFPEYTSGHSTFSGAAGTILAAHFGANSPFSSTSDNLLEGGVPVTRSFASFDAAVDEAGKSRVYGGIHFEFANADGKAAGRSVANLVLDSFDGSADTVGPRIFVTSPAPGATVDGTLAVVGHVLDNLTGVESLSVQLDAGVPSNVAFGPGGQFSFSIPVSSDGAAHSLTFLAVDFFSNSRSLTLPFQAAAPSAPAQQSSDSSSATAAAVDAAVADLSWLTLSAAAEHYWTDGIGDAKK